MTDIYDGSDDWDDPTADDYPIKDLTLQNVAETIHKARWPADRQLAVTPFEDEDRNGREYCFRIARAIIDQYGVKQPGRKAMTDHAQTDAIKLHIDSALNWHEVFDDGRGQNNLTKAETSEMLCRRLVTALRAHPAIGTPDNAREALEALYEWYDRDGSVGGASEVFEKHRRALAALPREQEAKPVAWRWRWNEEKRRKNYYGDDWSYAEFEPPYREPNELEIEPLYTAPPSDSPGSAHQFLDLGPENAAFHRALKRYPDSFEALHSFWNEAFAHQPQGGDAREADPTQKQRVAMMRARSAAPVRAAAEPGEMREALIHTICPHIRQWCDETEIVDFCCKKCPAKVETSHGIGVQMCRLNAEKCADEVIAALSPASANEGSGR